MKAKMTPQLKQLLILAERANKNGGVGRKITKTTTEGNDFIAKSRHHAEKILSKLG